MAEVSGTELTSSAREMVCCARVMVMSRLVSSRRMSVVCRLSSAWRRPSGVLLWITGGAVNTLHVSDAAGRKAILTETTRVSIVGRRR